MRVLVSIFLFLLGSANALSQGVNGTWQPSYAFNGKIPWYNGTLFVSEDNITFKTKGEVTEKWEIVDTSQVSGDLFDVLAKDGARISVFRFELNHKYQCEKESPFRYDPNCTDHDQKSPFRLKKCDSNDLSLVDLDSCKIVERYFDFHSSQLDSIKSGDYLSN